MSDFKLVLRSSVAVGVGLAAFFAMAPAFAQLQNAVTPSTNEINRVNQWAHVDQTAVGIGTTTLAFISTRNFFSCFEYRTDGNTSQVIPTNGGVNYNNQIFDGLYPFTCVKNNTVAKTFNANQYVEVRMVFGAEKDERFDWTRFDVAPDVASKDECKQGGWSHFGFKNQGQCVRYIETGQDSR